MAWAQILAAGLQLAGTAAAGSSANKAASRAAQAQEQADRRALAFAREQDARNRAEQAPRLYASNTALGQLMQNLGLGPLQMGGGMAGASGAQQGMPDYMAYLRANPDVAAAQPAEFSPEEWAQYHFQAHGRGEGRQMPLFTAEQVAQGQMAQAGQPQTQGQVLERLRATPGYQFALEEGGRQADARFAQRGMLNSGAAVLEAQRRGQQTADQMAWRPYQSDLMQLAGFGPAAAAANQQSGQFTANIMQQGAQNTANARASSFQQQALGQSQLYGSLANLGSTIIQNWPGRTPTPAPTQTPPYRPPVVYNT